MKAPKPERINAISALLDISIPYDPKKKIQFKSPFKMLVLKGGGQKAVVYAGMLKYFEEQGLVLPDIKEFMGTSAGGLTAGLLGLGYTSNDIKELFAKEFNDILHVHSLVDAIRMGISGLPNLLSKEHFGLIKPEDVIPLLKKKVAEKLGNPNATFRDLDNYIRAHPNCSLRLFSVIGAEVSTGEGKVFGINTTPDMCIAEALYVTMACQPIFAPLKYDGLLYGDGGISANNPLSFAEQWALDNGLSPECIFNARVDDQFTKKRYLGYSDKEDYEKIRPQNFLEYLQRLRANQENSQENVRDKVVSGHRTIIMDNHNVRTFEIDFTQDMVDTLYKEGYECAKEWHKNYIENTVAKIETFPTTYSKVITFTKPEAKERANILAKALCKLDEYKVDFSQAEISYYEKEVVFDHNLKNNQIAIFEKDNKMKWIGKDNEGKIFQGNLSEFDNLGVIEKRLKNSEELEGLNVTEIINDHIKAKIKERKKEIGEEIYIINYHHNYLPLGLGSALKYVNQAKEKINQQAIQSLTNKNINDEGLKAKIEKKLSEYMEIPPKNDNQLEEYILNHKEESERLFKDFKEFISAEEDLIQAGELGKVFLKMKKDFFKDLKACFKSMQACQTNNKQESFNQFKGEALKLVGNIQSIAEQVSKQWFEDLTTRLQSIKYQSENNFPDLINWAQNMKEETKSDLSTLEESIENMRTHRKNLQGIASDLRATINKGEAAPEIRSLKEDIEHVRGNLENYIKAQSSLFRVIASILYRLFNVKPKDQLSDVYYLGEAKRLKETASNLYDSINENNTKEALLEKREAFSEELESCRVGTRYDFFLKHEEDHKKYTRALDKNHKYSEKDFEEEALKITGVGGVGVCVF